MRIAALVKQIPQFEVMSLGPDGRLVRDGLPLEMNAYCRRAVAKAVELAAANPGSEVVVITLGPPSAEDVLREAVAWSLQRGVAAIEGVLVTDPRCAGSDTIATARALAAALARLLPFDLVLCGRNSIDADTGQVGPQLAEVLDLPFVGPARELEVERNVHDSPVRARVELDDGHADLEARLPAVVSCAERLCEPSKVDPEGRAAVDVRHLRVLCADDLGAGPFGQHASRTRVGPTRVVDVIRDRHRSPALSLDEQVRSAVTRLVDHRAACARRAADDAVRDVPADQARRPAHVGAPTVAVLVEPDRRTIASELLDAATRLAARTLGRTIAISPSAALDAATASSLGADELMTVGSDRPDEFARAVADWARTNAPFAVLAPSTAWGRETAARLAVLLDAGLTGDAVDLDLDVGPDGTRPNLVAWKPAFGGAIVAAISATSATHLVTVRPGMLATRAVSSTRAGSAVRAIPHTELTYQPLDRVRLIATARDDDLDTLANAAVVVGVGRGVPPECYAELGPLCDLLGAPLGATRKVTDNGWLPRARQIGITGRSVAPELYVSIGAKGAFNHAVGYRNAGFVLAINVDPDAPVFDTADAGIVGDWRDVLPRLAAALSSSGLAQELADLSGR